SQPRLERTLNNSANVVLTSTSSFFINGGTFNHQSGAVFDIQANVGIFDSTPGSFNNGGTLRKAAGAGARSHRLAFNKTGTVEVEIGTLNLTDNGTHTGAFNVTSGAILQFGGGTHSLSAASSINAANATVNLNTTEAFAGGYSVGTTNMNGGTASFNMGSVSFTAVNLAGGTMNGSADFSFASSSTLNWTGGIMSGAGITTIAAGATFTLAGSQPRLERTLNNSANVVLTSTSSFFINGGTFNHQSGAVFDIQANVGIFDSTPGSFNNGGTLRKSAGTGTSSISLPFNNTGTVEVQTGVLS